MELRAGIEQNSPPSNDRSFSFNAPFAGGGGHLFLKLGRRLMSWELMRGFVVACGLVPFDDGEEKRSVDELSVSLKALPQAEVISVTSRTAAPEHRNNVSRINTEREQDKKVRDETVIPVLAIWSR
jgi:hypothetical protein